MAFSSSKGLSTNYYFVVLIIVTGMMIGLTYQDIVNHNILHWDDKTYIHNNPLYQDTGLLGIFTKSTLGGWHPLTWLSLGFDRYVGGTEHALIYKVHNLVLHLVNSLLAAAVTFHTIDLLNRQQRLNFTRTQTQFACGIVSILFAVHPQHVESVVWIAERKDLLFSLFYLLGICCYFQFSRTGYKKWFILTIGSGLLAMLSKPMAVSFPVILILLDLGLLKNHPATLQGVIQSINRHKLTLLSAAGVGLIAISFQSQIQNKDMVFTNNLIQSALAFDWHIYKFVFSTTMAPYYAEPTWISTHPSLGLALLLPWFLIVVFRKKVAPEILIALCFYTISILPTIGLINFTDAAYADRFSYIPTLPFFILTSVGIIYLLQIQKRLIKLVSFALCLFILVLTFSSSQYTKLWRDDYTLWKDLIFEGGNVPETARLNFGNALLEKGSTDEAIKQYEIILDKNLKHFNARVNLAYVLSITGKSNASHTEYKKIAEIFSHNPWPSIVAAQGMLSLGDFPTCRDLLSIALKMKDPTGLIHHEAAKLYHQMNDHELARKSAKKSIEIDPDRKDYHELLERIE